jgi:hypothetical protein
MNWVRALGLALVTALTCVPHNASAGDEPYRAVVDTDGIQRVTILGGSYFFKPDHIIVKANVPVELAVRVEPGVIPHSFVLKASEAGITIIEHRSQKNHLHPRCTGQILILLLEQTLVLQESSRPWDGGHP